ncbi:hypothetical protein JCM17960_33710 [Magnetospira thiophila]
MADSPLGREMALRIGLAARSLPDCTPGQMLALVEDMVGLPPQEKDIQALRPKHLKAALDGLLEDVPKADLEAALRALKGKADEQDPLLPDLDPYVEGDMPQSIRVACASNTGEALDGHFGSCARFLIYQVSSDETRLIDVRSVSGESEADDKNEFRAALIGDCQVLFIVSIGGPAAAKVVKRFIHPIKQPTGGNAREQAAGLRAILSDAPPPWLAKVMGHAPESRIRFAMEEE